MPRVHATFSSFVPPDKGGLSLLEYLVRRFPYLDEEGWRARIAAGAVTVDGAPAEPDRILRNGDKVSSEVEHDEPELPEEVEVVRADGEILALGKSALVPVSRTGEVTWNTFVQQARRKTGNPEIRLLHRLDRETSGLILCARDLEAARRHQPNLKEILLRKFYLAAVFGEPEWSSLRCETPLREATEHPARAIMLPDPAGKPCSTDFRVLERSGGRALVLAEIRTGRKHQIRAHLASLGHPVVGDKIYVDDGASYVKMATGRLEPADLERLGAPHHLLHSWKALVRLPGGEGPELLESRLFSAPFREALARWPGWESRAESALAELLKS